MKLLRKKTTILRLYKISFCTTCMGRLHHIKETFLKNIEKSLYPHCEFILVNYNSPDDLDEWAKNLPKEVIYIKTTKPTHWLPAHAKNIAHRAATGDILCNIDADNFIVPGFAHYLNELFQKDVVVRGRGAGVYGRVALRKEHFYAVNGYDENLTTWSGEDTDLARRVAQHFNIKLVDCNPGYLKTLEHSNYERAQFLPGFKGNAATAYKELREWTNQTSKRIKENLAAGKTVANQGVSWGAL